MFIIINISILANKRVVYNNHNKSWLDFFFQNITSGKNKATKTRIILNYEFQLLLRI